ncbi:MATH and LRR domain-containing protein PFE0570w-like [Helianthus annuus]|uniref:MATH and LRR domain-containing protein PFE0570w-like n=1 Tax=Helianthus annuus TaxID=4232 RepID=UPI000B8F6DD6|nr:MATH and LRR domain-containing protein PFE0570w-like [Helianthus annuus]
MVERGMQPWLNLGFWKGKRKIDEKWKKRTVKAKQNSKRHFPKPTALRDDRWQKRLERKEGYPIERVTTRTLDMFEGALAKRHDGKEVKKKTVKKAKEATPNTAEKMQVVNEEDADGDDVENEDEDDVGKVEEHADNDYDEVDDDGFDHDDHYDYAELDPEVQNTMHINDENENDGNENEDKEALIQRIVDKDIESQNMMFKVSASGNHALAMADKLDGAYKELEDYYNKMSTSLKQSKIEHPNNHLVHIKYSQCLTLLENMSKFVDENTKEVATEREEGENEGDVEKEVEGEKEVEVGGENEGEWEEEMAGKQNDIKV